jgi:hypothetical protein
MYNRILVPLDGSSLAEITLSFTAELVKRLPGVEVTCCMSIAPGKAPWRRCIWLT